MSEAAGQSTRLFRAGLLEDVTLLLAGRGELGDAVAAAAAALGARVRELPAADLQEEQPAAQVVSDVAGGHRVDVLVVDGAALFGGAGTPAKGGSELAPLRAALDRGWDAIRAVANAQLIPQRAGKVVLLAPRPETGPYAGALRTGLENLARTLSIEWARYGITPTAIAPGTSTSAQEVASVTCFLCSRAGDFFSGCLLELGAVAESR